MAAITSAAIMAAGVASSAYGASKQRKDARNAAKQGTTSSPWAPAVNNLEYGLNESRALYEGRTPPPRMDYEQFGGMIPGAGYLPGGSGSGLLGQAGGGGAAAGGGGRGGGGRGGRGGGGGGQVGFGGGIPGLNEDYELYMSGGDFANMDSEFYRNYSDAARRAVERTYAPRRDALLDAFDPGMMPTTMMGQREAALEGEIGTAIGDSVIGGYGDMRGQNIGLIQSTMGAEQGRLQSKDQLAGTRSMAAAQRYSADKRAQADMAGVNAQNARTKQEAAQWAYQQRILLAEAEHGQDMNQWQAPGAQLDDFLRRSMGVGGMGGKVVGPPPTGPNAWQSAGSSMMGIGSMGLGGAFGGGTPQGNFGAMPPGGGVNPSAQYTNQFAYQYPR